MGSGFKEQIEGLEKMMTFVSQVPQNRWQGRDVSKDPSAKCYEIQSVDIRVDLGGVESFDYWRDQIKPNLPWADDHFAERVCGKPLNPGEQWKNWPWGRSASTFLENGGRYNHSYMERLWPRFAGDEPRQEPLRGIRNEYGDLLSIVDLLVRDPYTRQAYIPLFFPEDTGWGDGGRKPCTLGYQFLVRDSRISIWYPMRSCDLVRHLRDDCYMAVRLLLWVLDQCRGIDPWWKGVTPGDYWMSIMSLHVFENDMRMLRDGKSV